MRIQILILGFKGLNGPMACLLNNDTFLNRPQSMRQGAEKPSRSDVSTLVPSQLLHDLYMCFSFEPYLLQ